MANQMDLPVSAIGDDGAPSRDGRGRPATKAALSPVKRMKNLDTSDPSQTAVGVVLAPSTAYDHSEDFGARRDVILAPAVDDLRGSTPVVVDGLRPRQVVAASLLVQGRRGKDVAAALGVSAETVSRWRQQPEFQALMHRLLQETIDTASLGIVSLCAESIDHLRGLVRSFDDAMAMKAITLVLGKVAPVLGVIGTEMRRPSAQTGGPA